MEGLSNKTRYSCDHVDTSGKKGRSRSLSFICLTLVGFFLPRFDSRVMLHIWAFDRSYVLRSGVYTVTKNPVLSLASSSTPWGSPKRRSYRLASAVRNSGLRLVADMRCLVSKFLMALLRVVAASRLLRYSMSSSIDGFKVILLSIEWTQFDNREQAKRLKVILMILGFSRQNSRTFFSFDRSSKNVH